MGYRHRGHCATLFGSKGATLVEFIVIAPTLLFSLLGLIQTGLVFHAKSNVNYGAFEAARAGSTGNAQLSVIRTAFANAMTGYYGGGRNTQEVTTSTARAHADILPTTMRVELLSPSKQSFNDYASPQLSTKLNTSARVIPNNNLSAITCPMDRQDCASNPVSNTSGQTLSDANILKLRITYGIPAHKQIPLVGRFYVMALRGLSGIKNESSALIGLNDGVKSKIANPEDAFFASLLAQNRIPVVTHIAMRMQSEAIENGNAEGGTGNHGAPTDPGVAEPVYPGDGGDSGGNGGGSNGSPHTDAGEVSCGETTLTGILTGGTSSDGKHSSELPPNGILDELLSKG